MSKLSKFLGKPEEVDIDGEKFIIHPLRVRDLTLFGSENLSNEAKIKLTKELIKKSLDDATITDEEIDNLDASVFIKIMNAIKKINNLEDEQINSIKRRIMPQKP